jgi:Na+/proline symporter
MNYLSADHLVVYAFLIITLIIGLRAGRGIKDIREYAIANKTFSTAAIVLTFLATDLAGESVLDLAGEVSKTGIILAVVFIVGVGGGFLIQALFIAPNIAYFNQSITMGDVMGTLYGVNSKIIAGLLGFFTAICVAGMELTVLGLLCESLLGIDYRWGIGLGGIVLAIYSAHGGIKSVTVTDLFQFIILLVGIPMLTILALKHAGGLKVVLTQVPSTQLRILDHPNFPYYLALFLGKILFQFPMVDPALIQRFLMAKTRTQLRNQFLTLAVFSPALYLTIMLIGMAGLVLYPTLQGQQVVPHLINNLLPVGIKGIAMAGLFAVTMSTIDSFLHAAGLTLVHDVVKPLCDKRGITIKELNWTKYVTIFISLFAIGIGLARAEDLYGILLVSYEFTCPLLAFPLWCGIMGLKPDRHAFYTAAGITSVVLIVSKWLLPATHTYLAPFISVVVNGIVFLGLHAIRNQGFVIVSRKQAQEYLWRPRTKSILTQFTQFLPTPKAIVTYSNTKVIEYGAPYMTLGIFCVVNYIIPYFMWEHDSAQVYDLMLYLRFVGAVACSLLIVKDAWPSVLSRYLPAFWHLTLLYCLPFTSTVMFLLTQGSIEWLINVAVTIMFLIVLVDWVSFFILTGLGIALGFLFYTQLLGPVTLKLDFTTGYLLIYQAIFATLIGLLFARRRQQKFDRLAASKQQLNDAHQATVNRLVEALHYQDRISKNLGKEGIGILEQVYDLSKELQEKAKSTADNSLQATSEKLASIAAYFNEVVERAKDYLKLHVANVSLDTLLQEVYTNIKIQDLAPSVSLSMQVSTQQKELQGDVEKIKKLLINAIGYLQGRNLNNHQIQLEVVSTQLGYQIASIKDYIKKVDALGFIVTTEDSLPSLAALYIADTGATLVPPDSPADLPKVENERIIAAHYGVFENYETAEGCTHIYIIPLRVRDIRPSTMDLEELGNSLEEVLVAYPGATELEAALKDKVKETAPEVNMEKVTEAISLIKKYHTKQQRKSGEPFYFHPIMVAEIVLGFCQQEEVIIAALLHDMVEDTPMGLEQIAAMFNPTVAYLVDGVTNFDKGAKRLNLSSYEVIKKLTDEEDARVLYIKLADRIHNMRTIKAHPSYKKQKQIAEQTLQFFVPMAKQLGLNQAAEELNSLVFEVLNRGTV